MLYIFIKTYNFLFAFLAYNKPFLAFWNIRPTRYFVKKRVTFGSEKMATPSVQETGSWHRRYGLRLRDGEPSCHPSATDDIGRGLVGREKGIWWQKVVATLLNSFGCFVGMSLSGLEENVNVKACEAASFKVRGADWNAAARQWPPPRSRPGLEAALIWWRHLLLFCLRSRKISHRENLQRMKTDDAPGHATADLRRCLRSRAHLAAAEPAWCSQPGSISSATGWALSTRFVSPVAESHGFGLAGGTRSGTRSASAWKMTRLQIEL